MKKVRILVADDSEVVRQGLKTLLDGLEDWLIVAEAVNGREVIEKTQQFQPDIVILDYSMPELDGLSALPKIRQSAPKTEILILTQHDAPYTVRRALAAGARGYVVKSDASQDLLPALEAVSQHKIYLSSSISGGLWGDSATGDKAGK